jgi:mono/diheme cytochrome c family protein
LQASLKPLLGLLLASYAYGQTGAGAPDFFESKVRPILATNCYACHTNSQLAGLRLDSRAAMLKGGQSGPSLVPGDPDKSLLIQAVRQTGELKMPKGGKLKKEEVEALVEWVRAGAVWPEAPPVAAAKSGTYVIRPEQRAFWSFQPIRDPAIPAVQDASWPKTNIDRFILARLEKEGLTPAKFADRRTLLRRVTLDLTGFPPTFEETEAFQKDAAPDAFAKVVDRLLASPEYGERWGRMWLDVARYGEDDYRSLDPMRRGYNPYPCAYLYRDWVIKAFNDDLPYDLFVKAQLAADSLDEKIRVKMLPALGFLGLGPWFYDNGAVEITRADERHDRVDVISRGFLGLTVGCARCHDHKYDPIPTKDYYAMAGVFANTMYYEYALAPKAVVDEYKTQEKQIENKEKLLHEFLEKESEQLAESLALQSSRYMQAAWKVLGEPKEEAFWVVQEQKLDYELFERWLKFLVKPPKFYPYLTKWQEMIKRGGTAEEAKTLGDEFQALLLDVMFEQKELKEENEIIQAKALPGTKKKERAKLPSDFVTNDDFCPGCGLELKALPQEKTKLWTDVFEHDLQEGFDPFQVFDLPHIKPGLLAFEDWGLERQLSAERRGYIDALRADIEARKKALPARYPYVHGARDVEKPVNLKVSLRGNPFNLGDEVPRGFLSVLGENGPVPFTNGSGRMELAEAILKQPISVRVIVNRIWKGHFGTGLVDSPSNFGMTGERPTNPELLEYLAHSFVASGQSIKKLHREILLSSVYQLSNDYSQSNFEKDSGNRLYWRANRRRMDAEQIRDSLLFVSGALDSKMYGPSAPLTPAYNRRTVYGKVSRYRLDEYLQLFDFPPPNMSAEKRFTTNVPLQRLFFMNSDFAGQQAELLARRVASEPDNAARIRKAYGIVLGRAPTDEELKDGLEYLKREPMQEYEERKAAAQAKKEADLKAAKDAKPAATAIQPGGGQTPKSDMYTPDGMMGGVTGPSKAADEAKLLPPTAWGRYAKILLSSGEFLYVN